METPQAIRGTQDIFGAEAEAFAHVVETFERVRKLYRFRRAEMPVFEKTAVFSRSLGETTDVVSKEMYSFEDRGGDSLTLRPEFTAGIARAYLTNGWQQHAPLKLATHGPLFRYERPQKGRYRQFHQIDAEIIGAAEPQADVELLVMADQLLKELGFGRRDADAQHAGRRGQPRGMAGGAGGLFPRGPGRLVGGFAGAAGEEPAADSGFQGPARQGVPGRCAHDRRFSVAARRRIFSGRSTSGLDAAGVEWTRAPALVRGLDYYRHTAFEFVTDRLGAQGTVLGGGRYDGLIERLAARIRLRWAGLRGSSGWRCWWGRQVKRRLESLLQLKHSDRELDAAVLVTELRRAGIRPKSLLVAAHESGLTRLESSILNADLLGRQRRQARKSLGFAADLWHNEEAAELGKLWSAGALPMNVTPSLIRDPAKLLAAGRTARFDQLG